MVLLLKQDFVLVSDWSYKLETGKANEFEEPIVSAKKPVSNCKHMQFEKVVIGYPCE